MVLGLARNVDKKINKFSVFIFGLWTSIDSTLQPKLNWLGVNVFLLKQKTILYYRYTTLLEIILLFIKHMIVSVGAFGVCVRGDYNSTKHTIH